MAQLSAFSRFVNTELTIVDGNETYGKWNAPSWLAEKPEERFILNFRVDGRFEGRPDLISNEVYGNIKLDWVLVAFNAIHYNDLNARNILNWPRAGDVIKYPDINVISQTLI